MVWGGARWAWGGLGWGRVVDVLACVPPTPVPAAQHAIGLPSHTAIRPSIDPTNAQPLSLRPLGRCKCAAGCSVAWLPGWLLGWLVGWSVFGGLARWLTGFCFAGRVFGWADEAVSRKHAPWRAGLFLVVWSASWLAGYLLGQPAAQERSAATHAWGDSSGRKDLRRMAFRERGRAGQRAGTACGRPRRWCMGSQASKAPMQA